MKKVKTKNRDNPTKMKMIQKGTGKGQSCVPGGKKYKEVISGSKNINAPMPPNVNEFEYVPVNNDVDQDLEERAGGEANKIHT